jgi:predicted GNAT superfamily acetyltransferase
MNIRNARLADFAQILALNEESVRFLSPLSLERLHMMHDQSVYHRVIETDGGIRGFLLALREGATYDSANYLWFEKQYPKFLYIDRVVVSRAAQGQKLGKLLYEDLFAYARSAGVSPITCEFDIEPPNLPSQRFHEALGFKEVGSHHVGTTSKRVSLQALWPVLSSALPVA